MRESGHPTRTGRRGRALEAPYTPWLWNSSVARTMTTREFAKDNCEPLIISLSNFPGAQACATCRGRACPNCASENARPTAARAPAAEARGARRPSRAHRLDHGRAGDDAVAAKLDPVEDCEARYVDHGLGRTMRRLSMGPSVMPPASTAAASRRSDKRSSASLRVSGRKYSEATASWRLLAQQGAQHGEPARHGRRGMRRDPPLQRAEEFRR